jgi:hypothetical protein
MWIRSIPNDLERCRSFSQNLNFLWKSDAAQIYVMDNHLAAAWCWMKSCSAYDCYNFLHIDQHKDTTTFGSYESYSHLSDPNLSLDDYTKLVSPNSNGSGPTFRWDNYIHHSNALFPNWFNTCYFATHRDINIDILQSETMMKVTESIWPYTMISRIDELMDESKNKWIVNLDLDYFFDSDKNRYNSDDYIRRVSKILLAHSKQIQVLTIALSPECCGGWRKAIDCFDIFAWSYSPEIFYEVMEKLGY